LIRQAQEQVMGLLDSLLGGGTLSQIEAAAVPGLISSVLAKTNLGNLQGIVNQLQQGGLGPQVQSWLGSGLKSAGDARPASRRYWQ
jgi:uncharacterized protein YidB (DUF937 family)